jgi:PhnB protein
LLTSIQKFFNREGRQVRAKNAGLNSIIHYSLFTFHNLNTYQPKHHKPNKTMEQAIQPYLHFEDNCKDAMQYYQSIFGGDLEIMPIGDSPAKEHFPEALHHQILHSSLRRGNFNLMASDMCGQGDLNQGNSVQFNLDCTSEAEIRSLFEKLSADGIVHQPLEEQFWGDLFAMVVDKFGVRWMLSLAKK